MFFLTLIYISSDKPGSYRDLCHEYKKRLSPFVKIEEVVLKAETFRSTNDRKRVLSIEAERILNAIPKNSFSILLTEHGKTYDSPTFSNWIDQVAEHGARHLTLIIGGPLGIDSKLINQLDATFSLSPLTFPHDLARVVLLEQLYRAMTIMNKKTYHY